MRAAAAVLLAVALAGCSKKQPVVIVPPAPQATGPRTAPPVKRRPAPASPPATVNAPPVLEPRRTEEELAAVHRQVEASIRKAEQDLAAFLARQPSGAAQDVELVRSMLRQSRVAQSSNDLPSARSFAQRAEILAADLLKR